MSNKIRINLPEESFLVEIQGEQPTVSEKIKIADLIKSKQRGSQSNIRSRSALQQEGFDTRTGVRSASLRSSLSAAETNPEQEAILQKFGLQSEDYLRDNRGRLAVTPEGGKKLGLELAENTLIDEEGFSRYDLADIAGIAPEVIGGVGGAIAGQILIPIPILGAAIGAGLGSGGGSAVEEGIEALAGVSKQTAGEIAKDVATEATIGFLADATFGILGAGLRGARQATKVKDLPPEDEAIAAKSIEMNILPTLTAIRAPAIVGRQQSIIEKIFGTSKRLKQNDEVIRKKLEDFRTAAGVGTDEEAGRVLLNEMGKEKSRLIKLNSEAQSALIKQIDELSQNLGAAAQKNANIENELFDYLGNAVKEFDSRMINVFAPIDEALESTAGSSKIIPTSTITSIAKKASDEYKPNLAARSEKFQALQNAINTVKTLSPSSSFQQLYQTRKAFNDLRTKALGKSESKVITDLINQTDKLLMPRNIETFALSSGNQIPEEGLNSLLKASKSLKEARGAYADGARIFDEIESAGVVKNLRKKIESGAGIGVDDIRIDRIVKNNRPETLRRTLDAMSEASGTSRDDFRELIAGQWLRDALDNSGISAIDNYKPDTFRGAAFAKSIKDLGSTADDLFGKNVDQIRALAKSIEKSSLPNMTKESIDNVRNAGLNTVETLKQIELTQAQLNSFKNSPTLEKLASGEANISVIGAAELIAARKTSASDITKIMNAFDATGNQAGKEKVRGYFMENLIADFGDSLTTDGKTLGAFAKRLQDANTGGKLQALFGEEMGKDMAEFADILAFNSRTAAGGDLIAANIAASPIQNLGSLIRYSVIGRFLTSAPYYKQVTENFKKRAAGATPEEKANILGDILAKSFQQAPPQLAQEGIREGERQVRSSIENSRIGQELSNLSQQIQPPNISSGLAQVSPVPAAAPAGGLRERAKTDPGVAQALGIQGSTAGLL